MNFPISQINSASHNGSEDFFVLGFQCFRSSSIAKWSLMQFQPTHEKELDKQNNEIAELFLFIARQSVLLQWIYWMYKTFI